MFRDLLNRIGRRSPRVAQAMRQVPRDRFVPREQRAFAWDNAALPIGCGQTISQPSLVAYMTRQLALQPGDKVLEISTGSGYQAAILAAMGDVEVYAVEIVPELAARAAALLPTLGFTGVHFRQGDGFGGWPEYAPFNAIVVTAATQPVPAPLLDQLADGGRLVAPVGPPWGCQTLCKYVKAAGTITETDLLIVAFVPLTRD